MTKRFTLFTFTVIAVLLDIWSCIFFAKWIHMELFELLLSPDNEFSLFKGSIFIGFWLLVSFYSNVYVFKRADRFLRITLRLAGHLTLFFAIIQGLLTILLSRLPGTELVIFVIGLFFIQLTYRFLLFSAVLYLRSNNKAFKENILLIGDRDRSAEFSSFIQNNPKIGYTIFRYPINPNEDFTKKGLKRHKISATFIDYKSTTQKDHKKTLERIALAQIPIYIFANHNAIIKSKMVEYFGYIPVYKTQFSPLIQSANKIIKRLFDIVFSSLVIILILSWMYPLLGLLIKLESKGSIIFIQNRNGLGNKLFRCYKFRSMTVNNDKSQATVEDTRVTKIGRFIRKTSIDELPQFFNVLLGDMSVVGPRPHMEIHNANYEKQVASFQLRHSVKPGITGMAQMRGFRGEIREDIDIINRVKYDIFYIRNWSFALDIKIIIRTVINIFKGEDKAY